MKTGSHKIKFWKFEQQSFCNTPALVVQIYCFAKGIYSKIFEWKWINDLFIFRVLLENSEKWFMLGQDGIKYR